MNLIICAGLWNLIPCEWFDIKLYLWNVSDFEDKFEGELKKSYVQNTKMKSSHWYDSPNTGRCDSMVVGFIATYAVSTYHH